MNNLIAEIKDTLEGMKSRQSNTEEHVSDLEVRKMETTQSEQQQEKQIKKNNNKATEDSWDNIKHPNICIIWVPEGEEKERKIKNVFEEIMPENSQT